MGTVRDPGGFLLLCEASDPALPLGPEHTTTHIRIPPPGQLVLSPEKVPENTPGPWFTKLSMMAPGDREEELLPEVLVLQLGWREKHTYYTLLHTRAPCYIHSHTNWLSGAHVVTDLSRN